MLDITSLKTLQKRSSQSFHQQKKFIADVLAGKQCNCPHCGKALLVEFDEAQGMTKILCKKLCTNLVLER
ncbi:hypothetical protein [Thalassotalea sediminis]|uniref:hypothetical protein n=1 Tax=Thalassotalea sediminis TaxID=1759089 RepID=UPI002573FC5B|nr:hypothetical protein [Thalassotalea sediminis]